MSVKLWCGTAVLLATFTLPQHVYKAAPQGFDTVVGRVAISVIRTDVDGTLIRPVMPPTFVMTQLDSRGSQIAPGFAICTVIKRIVYADGAEKLFVVTTVLKCGTTEFYMKDVLFEVERHGN